MLVWVRRADWDALLRRLGECEEELRARRAAHAARSRWRDTLLVKVIPTVGAVAVAYASLATIFHWNG